MKHNNNISKWSVQYICIQSTKVVYTVLYKRLTHTLSTYLQYIYDTHEVDLVHTSG